MQSPDPTSISGSMSIARSNRPKVGVPTRLISSNREQRDPQYSPDGRKIAFGSARSGPNEIWVSDADGQAAMQLTHFGGYCGSPRRSPDSSQIAFDARPNGNPDIFVIRADGGSPDASNNQRGRHSELVALMGNGSILL